MANKIRTHGLELLSTPLAMGFESVVKGEFNPAKVFLFEDFLGDTLNTDLWAEKVDAGGNANAIVAGAANGVVALATNATDNDLNAMYGAANWYGQQNCTIECRLKVNAITEVGVCFGFTNAEPATDNHLVHMIASGTTVTDGTNVTDAATFAFDTDGSNDKWYLCTSKATSTVGGAATALAPEANTYEVLKIMIDSSGNCHFFRNGVALGTRAAAITATVALAPYFAVKNNNNTARLLTVDYVKLWQDRAESATVIW